MAQLHAQVCYIAGGLALASVSAAVFIAIPERLNDQPYNPLGSDTSQVLERPGRSANP